jgi:hypothetical protein
MSGTSMDKAVPLERLVERARQILSELSPMVGCYVDSGCYARCSVNRAASVVIDGVHGQDESWSTFSQYVPWLRQAMGEHEFLKELARGLEDFSCSAADVEAVRGGRFWPEDMSRASFNALGMIMRRMVGIYVMRRLVES